MFGKSDPTELMFFAIQDEDIHEDDWLADSTKPLNQRNKKDDDDKTDEEKMMELRFIELETRVTEKLGDATEKLVE